MSRGLATVTVGIIGLIVGVLLVYFLRPALPPPPVPTAATDWYLQSRHHCIVASGDPSNAIDVETDPLGKKGKGHGIRWHIPAGQPFSFPSNGIAFATAGGFACAPIRPTIYECVDADGTPGVYKYTVTLTSNSTSVANPLPADPHIVNN